jgi:hypothetical protein
MGALSLKGKRIALGGLGRRCTVDARPDYLVADAYARGTRLRLSVTSGEDAPVTVTYSDPRGGTRDRAAVTARRLRLSAPGQAGTAVGFFTGTWTPWPAPS